MRKNKSKFKNQEYVLGLINRASFFDNITYINQENDYLYFNCNLHGIFKKRIDHIVDIKHNTCPKCSKQIYSKIVGKIISKKHNYEDYIDITKYVPLEKYKNTTDKVKFLCTLHNKEFIASANRCFGCEECKKAHHYKWQKDWKHIDQEEIIKRCKIIHPEYDYSLVKYKNATSLIDVICPKHGVFKMSYANLTNKTKPQNCPFCSKMHTSKISKMTKELLDQFNKLNIQYETEKTFEGLKDKKKLPIDIYLPKYNIVIECQGAQHFRLIKSFSKNEEGFEYIKNHDKIKYEYFKNSNYKLLYYTKEQNKDLIPNNYFDKVYTNIEELINTFI